MTYIDKVAEFCLQHQVQKAFGKAGDMLKAWTEPSMIWLEFNLLQSLVATAPSLKSKVEQVRGGSEKCDAEAVPQPDSSWELCTLTTEDLGSKILAADGSLAGVTHPPEMSEKRGKVVLRTAKVQLEVTADHRVVNVTREGAQRQVSAVELSVGDLVVVDNETAYLTRIECDLATVKS